MACIQAEAEKLINYTINFNSPQNVAHVLFDFLKLKIPQDKYTGKKFSGNTRKGNRSTSEAILKRLESQHKLPSMILGNDSEIVGLQSNSLQSTEAVKSYYLRT